MIPELSTLYLATAEVRRDQGAKPPKVGREEAISHFETLAIGA